MIQITWWRHEGSGQLAATSDDLLGLVVFGETEEEIAAKLPNVVRELLVEDGKGGLWLADGWSAKTHS